MVLMVRKKARDKPRVHNVINFQCQLPGAEDKVQAHSG